MAESYDKRDMSLLINDDMIKDALKTGLKSIKASEDLAAMTIAKCRNEIINNHKPANRSLAFMPLVGRIGAPLAAGALVLVLLLNGPFFKGKQSASAPEGSGMQISALENASAADKTGERNYGTNSAMPAASSAPEMAFAAPSESPVPEAAMTKGKALNTSSDFNTLNSSLNRTPNDSRRGQAPSSEVFEAIVNQYNAANGTQLTLDENGATRIEALVEGGVTSDRLAKSTSYRDILSGEGYWALPLKNTSGEMVTLLTVNSLSENSDMPVSNLDIVCTVDRDKFMASPYPEPELLRSVFAAMFDSNALTDLIKAKGYKNVTEITAVDINYGMDFMVFARADDQELGIPFMRDAAAFGIENNHVYARDELFKLVSQGLNK